MKSACTRAQHLMAAELDGDLAPTLRRDLESHLAVCALCRRELDHLRRTVLVLEALRRPEPGPAFVSETLRRARLARQAQASRERRPVRPWALAALAVGAGGVAVLRAAVSWDSCAAWLLALTPGAIRLVDGVTRVATSLRDSLAPFLRSLLISVLNASEAVIDVVRGAGRPLCEAALPTYVLALVTLACLAMLGRTRAAVNRIQVERMP